MITQKRYEDIFERLRGLMSTINQTAKDNGECFTNDFWDDLFSLAEDLEYELKRVIYPKPKKEEK